MKQGGGPHRRLQLLSGSTQSLYEEQTPKTVKSKYPQVPSLALGGHTPTNANTLGSGRSDVKLTPTKKIESPRLNLGGTHQMRQSVSSNQIQMVAGSNKAYHPVLKNSTSNVVTQSAGRTPTNGQHHIRRQTTTVSTNSATHLAEKSTGSKHKSGSKPSTTIKEQPFNYEVKQKSADTVSKKVQQPETAMKEVKKQLNNQYEHTPPSIPTTTKAIDSDIKVVEIFMGDPNLHLTALEDRDEVRMRPSDEVSMNQDQQLLFAIGSGFSHSRIGSGQNWGLNRRAHDEQTNSSYRVFMEENKSDFKIVENDSDEKFEVIREDLKDSFYSPHQTGPARQIDNSDFKKFTGDEDFQSSIIEQRWQQRLAEHSKMTDPFGHGEEAVQPVMTQIVEVPSRLNIGESVEKQSDLEDTPKNIKDRAKAALMKDTSPKTEAPQFARDPGDGAHALSFSEDNPPPINNTVQKGENFSSFSTYEAPQQQQQQQVAAQQAANAIIEIEKNYVIMQYESLLQQLSVEFQKLLSKSKDTDEHLAQQELLIQTQQKIIQEKEAGQFQQEQVNSQLSSQVQELLSELEALTVEKSRRQMIESESEQRTQERELMENTVQNLQSKVRLYESAEICTKDEISTLQAQVRQQEAQMRRKDEDLFNLQRQNSAYERDVQNLREAENGLRLELQRENTQRRALEEQMQEVRQRTASDQLLLRVRENELESLSRETKGIQGVLNTLQLSYAQVMRENDQLKGALSEQERSSIHLKSVFQQREAHTIQLETDVQRMQTIIEKERQRANKVEEDYRQKIELLQVQLREAQQREVISKNRSFDMRDAFQSADGTQRFQGGEYLLRESLEKQKGPWPTQFSRNSEVASQLQSVVPSAQQPMTSYQRAQLFTANISQQPVQQQQQQRGPHPLRDEGNNSIGNRRKTVNQNTSQLHELLNWSEQPQQPLSPQQPYKSVDRTNAVSANPYMAQGRVERYVAQSNFSPRQAPSTQDYMPAAGKKSTVATSPFGGEIMQKQTAHLQNTLSQMQIEKERFENEYRKLPTSKNKMQIERKKELEFEIEVVDKNIHQIKQKLKEINAL